MNMNFEESYKNWNKVRWYTWLLWIHARQLEKINSPQAYCIFQAVS